MSEVGEIVRDNGQPTPNEVSHAIKVTIKEKVEGMLQKLHSYDPSSHKIAKVPDFLRGGNSEAYDPKIISVGPIHHDKNHLKDMEQHKVWYLNQLLQRNAQRSLEEYMVALEELEDKARTDYSSLIQLPEKDEFVTMLLLDGIFVIELARKWSFSHMVEPGDYIFQFSKGDHSSDEYNKEHCNEELIQIRRDMLMIENQLPFFILSKLFEMSKTDHPGDNLYLLALKFFRRIIPGRPNFVSGQVVSRVSDCSVDHDHLLGLVYKAYFVDKTIDQIHNYRDFMFHEIYSASELHEAGIKFKKAGSTKLIKKVKLGGTTLMKVKYEEEVTLMNVKFEDGVIRIPKLEAGDVTESLFRNLIAYELIPFDETGTNGNKNNNDIHRRKPRYVTEYCFLMQFLVNSTKDVEILRRAGIVTNWMGDDEMVRLFFNKLTKNVASSQEFYYANIIRSMNKYCKKRRNIKKWWTVFERKYINSPWSISSVVAAFILLLITTASIVFAILTFFKKKTVTLEKVHHFHH